MDATARELIRQRAGNRCEYCLLPEESDEWPFHIEHIVAKQHGGSDNVDNLCLACSRCNLHKGRNIAGRDSDTGNLVGLFKPREHRWNDHFAFRGARIVGVTSIGRVSVRLLNMNDGRRLELRRDLIRRGIIQT